MVGIIEHIGGCLVDRHGARGRGRIGRLTGVNGKRIEVKLRFVERHKRFRCPSGQRVGCKKYNSAERGLSIAASPPCPLS